MFKQSNQPLSKIPFFSLLLLVFLSLKPCSNFHRFLAEISFSRLTSVVSGFSSSRLTYRITFFTFSWLAGVYSSYFACRTFIFSWQEAFRHQGTRYSGTNQEMVTRPWSSFFLMSLILFTRTYRSLPLLQNSSFSSGVFSNFFLKSSCWKRSALWLLMDVQTSLILYRKAYSSNFEMGISLMVECWNLLFSYEIKPCRLAISPSVFSMKVIRKGLSWKCSQSRGNSSVRQLSPSVMMEVMWISSKDLLLYAFLALALKTLLERSWKRSLVVMRMLVEPFIQTESTQKRRFIGFQWLQTPTPVIKQRQRKRAQRQTSRRFSTTTKILGLTSPNFSVTQRLIGRVSLSPAAQKCVICSSSFYFSSTTGGSQFILTVFFIHSFLNFSIS